MSFWQALLIATLLVMTGAHYFSYRKIRDRMIDRHAQRFLEIQRGSIFQYHALHHFILWGNHKDLADQTLSAEITAHRWMQRAAFAAIIASFFLAGKA